MKASNFQQKPTPFKPKPLSVEQESAVDLLLTGKSDREVGGGSGRSLAVDDQAMAHGAPRVHEYLAAAPG